MADALNEYAAVHSAGYSDWTTDEVERLTGHPATSFESSPQTSPACFGAERTPYRRRGR